MSQIQWKIIKNYENYAISNYGDVKRIVGGQGAKINKILKPLQTINGYMRVDLCTNGIKKEVFIHLLVLNAFIGLQPDRKECNHIDGNKQNNYLNNLEWVTHTENCLHAFKLGLRKPVEKLKAVEVWLIKRLLFFKIKPILISKMFKVHFSTIYRIKKGDSWGYI